MGRVKTDAAAKAKAKAEPKKEEPKEPEKPEAEEKPEDPPSVKHLKEIDDKHLALQKEYEADVQKLLVEYTKKQQPLLEERKQVLTVPQDGGPVTGTPVLSGFWLKAMQNHPAFEETVQEWDEPVLEFLTDIEKLQNEEDSGKGFKLTFRFLENPYFENTEIVKEYVTEESCPYRQEIEVKEIKSGDITWKAGKNVTVEKVAKKVKGGGAKKQKKKGQEKEEPRPSFFRDFFRNLKPGMEMPEDAKAQLAGMMDGEDDDPEADEEMLAYIMDNDYEVGCALRDNLIPFAIRWYTGEAAPDFERGEDDDEDSEEEDLDDDEEESSEDEAPKGRGKGGAKASAKKQGKAKAGAAPDGAKQEECKQQ